MPESILVTSAGTNTAVTLADAKTHLRVSPGSTVEDTLITDLIAAAIEAAQSATRMAFVENQYRYTLDGWPLAKSPWWDGMKEGPIGMLNQYRSWIELPAAPLVSVQSVVSYPDESDTPYTMPTTDYFVDAADRKKRGRVALRTGRVWPVALRAVNAVEINFTGGWGATIPLPADAKRAILMIVAYLYRKRGDAATTEEMLINSGAQLILNSYVLRTLR